MMSLRGGQARRPGFNLRGGETRNRDAGLIESTAYHDDIGTLGNRETITERYGVLKPSTGGPGHDAVKSNAVDRLLAARLNRALDLSKNQEKMSQVYTAKLGEESKKLVKHGAILTAKETVGIPGTIEKIYNDIFNPPEAAQAKIKKFKRPTVEARQIGAAAKQVAASGADAAYRARLEMQAARSAATMAQQSADKANQIPRHKRKNDHDVHVAVATAKLPSNLIINLAEGINFPKLKSYKNIDAFCQITMSKPGKGARRRIESQERMSAICWRQHDPTWAQTFEFPVNDEWGEMERDEYVLFEFYDANVMQKSTIQIPTSTGQGDFMGAVHIDLSSFCKFIPSVRYPDGTEDKAYFKGKLNEWFELLDPETGEAVMGSDDSEAPAVVNIKMIFEDSANRKEKGPTMISIDLPHRQDIKAPPAMPPKSWKDHPSWALHHQEPDQHRRGSDAMMLERTDSTTTASVGASSHRSSYRV